jgi:hypothetical protein
MPPAAMCVANPTGFLFAERDMYYKFVLDGGVRSVW